jgi:ferredoxin
MFSKEHKIYIEGSSDYYTVKSGTNLYKFLLDNKLINETLCKGQGQCGRCRALIKSASGKEINKPTKRDKLLLASVNLQAGFRLTCQYSVKSDIIVRLEKNESTFVDSEFISVKVKKNNNKPIESKIIEEEQITNIAAANGNDEGTLKDEFVEDSAEHKINEFTIEEFQHSTMSPGTSDVNKGYDPTDGLILIQYNKGIKYYLYSAGIASISSEGLVRTNESLLDVIDNNVISDFIYNNIQLNDIERVIIILDKKYFEGENLYNLVNYYPINIGTMLCEVIQPQENPLDLLLFFRLLYNNRKKNVFISLELLNSIYYFNEEVLKEININNKFVEQGMQKLLEMGKNPIIGIDNNYEVSIKDKYEAPDKINFTALLQCIKYLKDEGIIDDDLKLRDRLTLADKIPINKLVKLSNKDGSPIFYIYRKKNLEFYIDQKTLDLIYCCRLFINTVLKIIKSDVKRIDSIYIFTTEKYDNLINYLFDLEIIPQEYSKKVVYFSGEPSILTSKFFQYRNIKEYMEKNIGSFEKVPLSSYKLYSECTDIINKRINY